MEFFTQFVALAERGRDVVLVSSYGKGKLLVLSLCHVKGMRTRENFV